MDGAKFDITLARRYWDEEIGPMMKDCGTPDEGLKYLAKKYMDEAESNPDLQRHLEEHFASVAEGN